MKGDCGIMMCIRNNLVSKKTDDMGGAWAVAAGHLRQAGESGAVQGLEGRAALERKTHTNKCWALGRSGAGSRACNSILLMDFILLMNQKARE